MLGKHQSLKQMNWENIKARFGQDKFAAKFGSADLVGFVNWTMLTYMSDIWAAVLKEVCPKLSGPRRKLFIDLADPEKRTTADIARRSKLIAAFEKHFDVILGLNEKEAGEIGKNLGLNTSDHSPEGLTKLCQEIHQRVPVDTLVVHPTAYALAVGPDGVQLVQGPFTAQADDHHRRGRPFQLRLLPGQAARPGQRIEPALRRDHQRLLRPHRPEPGPQGSGRPDEAVAEAVSRAGCAARAGSPRPARPLARPARRCETNPARRCRKLNGRLM